MPASTAFDPDYVLWSAQATQRADRPPIVLLHGWSYDERHLFGFAHLDAILPGQANRSHAILDGGAHLPAGGRISPDGARCCRARGDTFVAALALGPLADAL